MCKKFPCNAIKAETRRELCGVLDDKNLQMKWTDLEPLNSGRSRQRCAFQLNNPTDISEFYIRLYKTHSHTRHPQIHFKAWLDKSGCGICQIDSHLTLDCPQLTETV